MSNCCAGWPCTRALRHAFAAIDLIEPERYMAYSGMLPATVAGHYARHEMQVDIAALARLAEANLHRTRLTRIDAVARAATRADGTRHAYDLLSLNIGAVPRSHRRRPSRACGTRQAGGRALERVVDDRTPDSRPPANRCGSR